ncbi:hypothetical protein M569_12085, partial [Genlisea aurea]
FIDTTQTSPPDTPTIRIFIGILTVADRYETRNLLRLAYGTQSSIGAQVDVRFMLCNLTTDDQRVLVLLEIIRYNDIIIMDCRENMEDGKTYTYFSSLPRLLASYSTHPPYHYVAKVDDDTYVRLQNLVDSLNPLPRYDVYYGFRANRPEAPFMTGPCYLVSWDIVEWISISDIPRNNSKGPEDLIFGEWMRDGNRGKNYFDVAGKIYDYPGTKQHSSRELWPGTVAIHRLKTPERWIKVLNYFNFKSN